MPRCSANRAGSSTCGDIFAKSIFGRRNSVLLNQRIKGHYTVRDVFHCWWVTLRFFFLVLLQKGETTHSSPSRRRRRCSLGCSFAIGRLALESNRHLGSFRPYLVSMAPSSSTVTLYSTTLCTLLSVSRTTRNTRTLSFP